MTRGVIATSSTTAQRLIERYGVVPERLAVARPGSDPASGGPISMRGAGRVPVNLLSIGTLTPRKGHDLLIEALARLAELPWTCSIVGSLIARRRPPPIPGADRAPWLAVPHLLAGEAADLSAAYGAADIFVLASRHEGYGMVFAEALQHGLPIIATTAGAIPEVVPPGAGILVPPDDVTALAGALAQLIARPRYARALCRRGPQPRPARCRAGRTRRESRRGAAPLRGAGRTAGAVLASHFLEATIEQHICAQPMN